MMQSADFNKHGHRLQSQTVSYVQQLALFGILYNVIHCYSRSLASLLPVIRKKLCKLVGCCVLVNYSRNHSVLKYIGWRYRDFLNLDVRIVAVVETIQTMPYFFTCIAIQHKSLNNQQYYLKSYPSNQYRNLKAGCSFGSHEILISNFNFLKYRHSAEANLNLAQNNPVKIIYAKPKSLLC